MKKNWTVDQKVKLVVGFTNSGMTKKAYCAKYSADLDGRMNALRKKVDIQKND